MTVTWNEERQIICCTNADSCVDVWICLYQQIEFAMTADPPSPLRLYNLMQISVNLACNRDLMITTQIGSLVNRFSMLYNISNVVQHTSSSLGRHFRELMISASRTEAEKFCHVHCNHVKTNAIAPFSLNAPTTSHIHTICGMIKESYDISKCKMLTSQEWRNRKEYFRMLLRVDDVMKILPDEYMIACRLIAWCILVQDDGF